MMKFMGMSTGVNDVRIYNYLITNINADVFGHVAMAESFGDITLFSHLNQ